MENTNPRAQHAHHGKQKEKDERGVVNPEPKKPGSKAQGRKRTKSGCLSELVSFKLAIRLVGNTSTNAVSLNSSMSKAAHQVRRGETNLSQLYKVPTPVRGLQSAGRIQRSHQYLSWATGSSISASIFLRT
jgi:hypothetical protein